MEANLKSCILSFTFIVTFLLTTTIPLSCAKITLKPEETKALEEFRPLVEDILTQDYQKLDSYLLRWLRAKKLNVKDAANALADSQKWRQKNNMETILDEKFPEFSNFVYTDDSVDKEGRTVFTFSLGSIDMRKIVLAGTQDRFLRFGLFSIEKAVRKAAENVLKSNGTLNDARLVSITDLHGFSLRKHGCLSCIPLYAQSGKYIEMNYPGVNGLAIYINTPRAALPVIEVAKTFISEETLGELKVFGTSRTEWSEYLHSIIDSDQLPYQYGGTKKN
jgi:hypothetical protein